MVSGRAVSREAGTLIREDGDSPGFIRGEDVKENMAATQERSKQFAQSFFTYGGNGGPQGQPGRGRTSRGRSGAYHPVCPKLLYGGNGGTEDPSERRAEYRSCPGAQHEVFPGLLH